MANPTITNSDVSSLLMFNGIFRDRSVTVGIGEVLAVNTVLGYDDTNSKTIACISTGTDGEDVPRFILMEELDNSAGIAAKDFDLTQVLVGGEVDAAFVVFDNGTDTLDTDTSAGRTMRDSLKTEGIITTPRTVEDELDNQ